MVKKATPMNIEEWMSQEAHQEGEDIKSTLPWTLLRTEICDARTSGMERAIVAAVRDGLRSAVGLGFSYTSLVSCASLRY